MRTNHQGEEVKKRELLISRGGNGERRTANPYEFPSTE